MPHLAGDPTAAARAADPRWRGEDPAVGGWGFGGPTVVGPSWSALEVDLEDELSRWPSFVSALQARGGKRGVASLCIGGGEATALAVEMA